MFESKIECPLAVSSPTDEGIFKAAEWCLDVDEENPLVLVTHQKSTIRNDGNLQNLAAQPWVEHRVLRGGLYYGTGPVLAFMPDVWEIAEILHSGWPTALCVVQWATPEVVPWAQMVGAAVLSQEDGDGARWDDGFPSLGEEVEEELERVTRSINHNNVLPSHFEKRDTVAALQRLHARGLRPDPVVVMAWAAAHGWGGDNVRTLGEWVGKVNAGRKLSTR